MSIALVGPLNRIAGVMEKGMLESYALVTARERVRNFVLSLQGAADAPLLEEYLQDNNSRAGWNAILGEPSDINAIAELALPFGAVANSHTALNMLGASKTALNTVAVNSIALNNIIANGFALNVLTATTLAMDIWVTHQIAMDTFTASQTAMDAIAASSMAIAKYTTYLAGLDHTQFADITAVSTSQVAMNALATSSIAMSVLTTSQLAMSVLAASQTAMAVLVTSQTAMDTMAASQNALVAMFGSVVAKRAIFDSQIAEVSIRSSNVAMSYAESIAEVASDAIIAGHYNSPSPINGVGKWFVVRCDALYSSGGYNRGIRYYRHGQQSFSGAWTDYLYSTVGIQAPFNEPIALSDANELYESLHGRFFTRLQVMARSGRSSAYSQTYRYINMDAEGSV